VRGGKHRVYYVKLLTGARVAQRIIRGRQGRTTVEHMRATRAAIRIQTCARRWLAVKHFVKAMHDIVVVQTVVRAHFAKKRSDALKYDISVLKIQSKLRTYNARKNLLLARKAVTGVQCGWRRKQAKRELKVLRVEAKQVGNLAKRVDDFKSRVQSLEVELSTERQRRRAAETSVKELASQLELAQEELNKVCIYEAFYVYVRLRIYL
jgi:myosin-5